MGNVCSPYTDQLCRASRLERMDATELSVNDPKSPRAWLFGTLSHHIFQLNQGKSRFPRIALQVLRWILSMNSDQRSLSMHQNGEPTDGLAALRGRMVKT